MKSSDAQKLLEQAKDYWSDNYKDAEEDLRFSIGQDHWSETDIKNRGDRPCLVINQLPQFIHQVTNDMRQNTPSINVIPGDNIADQDTAKIFKGLIRYIEYRSGADAVYDTAGESAVRCGIGFIRVDHDYVSGDSDEQELLIKRVPNVLSTFLDPSSIEPDGSDANWAISLDTISKEDFDKRYPGRQFVSFTEKDGEDDKKAKEQITYAELLIKNVTEYPGKTRVLQKITINRYKFNGEDEPLEETTFPGHYIPVVPVYGEEVWIKGKRVILSLIRQSKDAQRRLNHWASKETEILNMAPKAPIMAPVGSTEDFADDYEDPDSTPVLRYRQFDANGKELARPERLAPPPIPTGIINAMEGAKQNIKETLGLYNASLGQQSNEISGVAIDARKEEGDVSTLHFGDNLKRSIEHLGRILVCAIPVIYDTPRILHIIGDEEETQKIGVNGAPPQQGQDPTKPFPDLTKGEYDVRVTTGSSFATKRQEQAAFLGELVKAKPEFLQIFGDILFKSMDTPGAQAVAERIKKTIPPQLLAGEDGQQQIDPQLQQAQMIIEQMKQQMAAMATELQSKQAEQQNKNNETQVKLLSEQSKAAYEQSKLQLEKQTEANKTAYETAKLALENKKLDLEKQKVELDAQIKLSTAQDAPDIQDKQIREREMALKENEFRLKVEQARLDVIRQQQEKAEKPSESGDVETDTVNNTQNTEQLNDIKTALEGLIQAVSKPITITRDANGMISGAE